LRSGPAQERFAVGAATLSLLAAHAERRPVAVLIDDAHWLDGSTADALRFALRRLLADPVAVVLTVREGEPSLLDGTDLPLLTLGGLDAEATAALLRERAPAADARRLHDETGGNPLALVELARQAGGTPVGGPVPLPVPTSVSEAYVRRAESLPEATRRMLVLAATSDRAEGEVLARAAAPLGIALDDLAPAEEAGLIVIEGGRVAFRHPLARSAIYSHAGPAAQREAHRALAGALPDADVDRRAWHLALAATGVDETASAALEQAAGRAYERSAYDAASHAFERAARLSPDPGRRAEMLLSAAESAWLAGAAERVGPLLDEAAAAPDAIDGLAVRIDALRGHVAAIRGPVSTARELLSEAAEHAAATAPDQAVVMLAEAALAAFFEGDAAGLQAHAARAWDVAAAGHNGRTRFFADLIAGMAAIFAGEGERGATLIRSAVELLERSDELRDEPRLLWWAALGPLWLREAGTGQRLLERAVTAARANGAVGVLPNVLVYVGISEAASDRWAQARSTFDEAIRLARELGLRIPLAGCLSRLAIIEARAGLADAAREHAEEALDVSRAAGTHLLTIWSLSALGELESARGDVGAALEVFNELEAMLAERGIADADLSPAPEQVELWLRAGERERAAAAAGAFAQLAAVKGQPWALARSARCAALLTDDEALDEAFGHALALHERTSDAFETARTELAYGSRLRRAGRRQQAREQLRAALATFERLGAEPWADRADHELRATGETARRRDPSTLDDLTAQELRVALLLAGGRTTREAAAELFLSPKTVEYHLRNAYRKLGVRSREGLAEALRDQPSG
ncbi:MAG TPA: tetratricopeptide repeat protein, partial [Gaiellales bacterium]|nr:tetratricopeptide repeat protein [Gaiellales bacterium]